MVHRAVQPSPKIHWDKATERAEQNLQECFCQVLQQNLVDLFECLIICTGAALHTHTRCIYFSV